MTLAAVRLDPLSGTASVVSAGHGPVLLYTAASGTVAELPTHGLPLGIDADGEYDLPTDLPLAPGDAVVVLSDGLNESRDAAGRLYGIDRVKADVRRHAAGTPDGMARALVDAALAHAPTTRPADDMTAVVIQRCP